MKHYDHSMAGHFGKLLAAREAELRAALDTGNKKELEAGQPAQTDVQDFKDLAERESQHDIAALEEAQAVNELSQVLAALRRLRDGSFGQCLECGKPMDLRRLEALPAAAFCVACQAAGEKLPRQSRGI
jgi:RNA polymerase-binding transcription factor DksA